MLLNKLVYRWLDEHFMYTELNVMRSTVFYINQSLDILVHYGNSAEMFASLLETKSLSLKNSDVNPT